MLKNKIKDLRHKIFDLEHKIVIQKIKLLGLINKYLDLDLKSAILKMMQVWYNFNGDQNMNNHKLSFEDLNKNFNKIVIILMLVVINGKLNMRVLKQNIEVYQNNCNIIKFNLNVLMINQQFQIQNKLNIN